MTVRILPRLITRFCVGLSLACPAAQAADAPSSGQPPPADPPASHDGSVILNADQLRSDGADAAIAEGAVEVLRDGDVFRAGWLRYDRKLGVIDAHSKVEMVRPQIHLTGSTLHLKLETYSGTLDDPTFAFIGRAGRGDAAALRFIDRDHAQLTNARYTTCPATQDDWYLHVGTLDLDQTRQVGTARNTRLEFLGTPILYTPWIDFPLNDARKSGLLAPTFGTTERSGFDVSIPYYFNLAPNYDATLTPRLLTRRGALLGGEFRHLTATSTGNINAEYLPDDKVADRDRWSVFLNQRLQLTSRANLGLQFERVSDDDYFRDLSSLVALTSLTHLNRELYGSYQGKGWDARFQVQRYQTLQDPNAPVVTPYARLPNLQFNAEQVLGDTVDARLRSEVTRFDHPTRVSGDRAWIYPTLALPLTSSYGFITPKVGIHSTRYRLDDSAAERDISRTVPIVSLDTGLFLDRPFQFRGEAYSQTLEPRAYFVYARARDQSNIPVFDTAQLDFSYAQIFNENQFIGADRINDANQLTLAATTRFVEERSALERLRLTVGQRFYFDDQAVTLPGVAPRATNATDLLLAASGQVTRNWRFDSALQVDTENGITVRRNLSTTYRPAPGRTLNLGYRFIDQSTEQVDLSAQWPLAARWYGLFRLNYSLRDQTLVEGLAGLEYNAGCWIVRGALQRIATSANQSTDSLFIQLELNGLGRLGSNPLEVLKDSIPGYLPSNDF